MHCTKKLPLACDCRGISRLLKEVSYRALVGAEDGECCVVSDVGEPRHELDATGRTERLRVAMLKAKALACQSVEVRCPVLPAAVGAEALEADIVSHDENDVRLLWRALSRRDRYDQEDHRE